MGKLKVEGHGVIEYSDTLTQEEVLEVLKKNPQLLPPKVSAGPYERAIVRGFASSVEHVAKGLEAWREWWFGKQAPDQKLTDKLFTKGGMFEWLSNEAENLAVRYAPVEGEESIGTKVTAGLAGAPVGVGAFMLGTPVAGITGYATAKQEGKGEGESLYAGGLAAAERFGMGKLLHYAGTLGRALRVPLLAGAGAATTAGHQVLSGQPVDMEDIVAGGAVMGILAAPGAKRVDLLPKIERVLPKEEAKALRADVRELARQEKVSENEAARRVMNRVLEDEPTGKAEMWVDEAGGLRYGKQTPSAPAPVRAEVGRVGESEALPSIPTSQVTGKAPESLGETLLTFEEFQKNPLIRTVGEDFSDTFLHGTLIKNIKTLANSTRPESSKKPSINIGKLGDLLPNELNEFNSEILLSEPRQAQQAYMWSQGKGSGLAIVKVKKGTKILDLSDEATRTPYITVGTNLPEVLKFFRRPSITDDFIAWYKGKVVEGYKKAFPDWEKRIEKAFDPSSPNFEVRTWRENLSRYARDKKYGLVRLADETLVTDRSVLDSVRRATPEEVSNAAKSRTYKPSSVASLFTGEPTGAYQEAYEYLRNKSLSPGGVGRAKAVESTPQHLHPSDLPIFDRLNRTLSILQEQGLVSPEVRLVPQARPSSVTGGMFNEKTKEISIKVRGKAEAQAGGKWASRPVPEDLLLDTLAHEVGHGASLGHGKAWLGEYEKAIGAVREAWKKSGEVGKAPTKGETAELALFATQHSAGTNPALLRFPELLEIMEGFAKLSEGPTHPRTVGEMPGTGLQGALGVFYPKTKRILLLRELWKKDQDLATVIFAHEIGHYLSYLREQAPHTGKMKAPNSLLEMLDEVHQAGRTTLTNSFGEKVDLSALQKELQKLSLRWSPFDPTYDPKYTAYRFSHHELYADAFSAIVNNPALVQQWAPTWFRNWNAFLDTKPLFKAKWTELQERVTKGEDAIVAERAGKLYESMKAGEENRVLGILKALESQKDKTILREFTRLFIDKNEEIQRRVAEVKKKGLHLDPEENPAISLAGLPYVASEIGYYVRAGTNRVVEPVEKLGLSQEEFGSLLFARRILAGDYGDKPAPRGWGKKEAEQHIAFLAKQHGAEKLEAAWKIDEAFWKNRQKHVFPLLQKSEAFTPELEAKITSDRTYVTFSHQDAITNLVGPALSPKIQGVKGSVGDIENPFTATVMKDIGLIDFLERTITKNVTFDFLSKFYPESIKESQYYLRIELRDGKEVRFRSPVETREPGKQTVMVMKRGQLKGFDIPEYIAKSLEREPYEVKRVFEIAGALTAPLRAFLVTHNPWWAISNVVKDIFGAAKQAPGASLPALLRHSREATRLALLDMRGKEAPELEAMYRGKMLLIDRYYGARFETEAQQLERIEMEFGASARGETASGLSKVASGLWDALGAPGKFSERFTKILGYLYLKNRGGLSDTEIAHLVRTRVGTPDPRRAGTALQLYNNFFLFSNIGKEGLRAGWEAYREDPLAYLWRALKYNVIPTMVRWAAYRGLLEQVAPGYLQPWMREIRETLQGVSKYNLQNYLVIPWGRDENGKSVVTRFPIDYNGQIVTSLVWNLLESIGDAELKIPELAQDVGEANPWSQLNPLAKVALDTALYIAEKNPYDMFRGKYVVPEHIFLTRKGEGIAWESHIAFAKHIANTLGAGATLYKFRHSDPKRVTTKLETALGVPFLGRGLERFVMVTSAGAEEQLREAVEKVRGTRAQALIPLGHALDLYVSKPSNPLTPEAAGVLYKSFLRKGELPVGMDFPAFFKMFQSRAFLSSDNPLVKAWVRARTKQEKNAIILRLAESMNQIEGK